MIPTFARRDPADADSQGTLPPLPTLPVALIIAGAAVVLVAMLLPYVEPPSRLAQIEKNTLLGHGEWEYPVGIVVAAVVLYRFWTRGGKAGRIVWAGVFMGLWTIYNLAVGGARTYDFTILGQTTTLTLSPGVGLYAALVGSLLVAVGGTMLAFPRFFPAPSRKRCPACAEVVQEQATVCRFCGHEFSTS